MLITISIIHTTDTHTEKKEKIQQTIERERRKYHSNVSLQWLNSANTWNDKACTPVHTKRHSTFFPADGENVRTAITVDLVIQLWCLLITLFILNGSTLCENIYSKNRRLCLMKHICKHALTNVSKRKANDTLFFDFLPFSKQITMQWLQITSEIIRKSVSLSPLWGGLYRKSHKRNRFSPSPFWKYTTRKTKLPFYTFLTVKSYPSNKDRVDIALYGQWGNKQKNSQHSDCLYAFDLLITHKLFCFEFWNVWMKEESCRTMKGQTIVCIYFPIRIIQMMMESWREIFFNLFVVVMGMENRVLKVRNEPERAVTYIRRRASF